MHYIIFGAIALVFIIVSYLIGVKKQLNLICTLDESNICKIKNKKLTANIFALYYLFIGIVAMSCPIYINYYGDKGIVFSVFLLLILFLISIIASVLIYYYLKRSNIS